MFFAASPRICFGHVDELIVIDSSLISYYPFPFPRSSASAPPTDTTLSMPSPYFLSGGRLDHLCPPVTFSLEGPERSISFTVLDADRGRVPITHGQVLHLPTNIAMHAFAAFQTGDHPKHTVAALSGRDLTLDPQQSPLPHRNRHGASLAQNPPPCDS